MRVFDSPWRDRELPRGGSVSVDFADLPPAGREPGSGGPIQVTVENFIAFARHLMGPNDYLPTLLKSEIHLPSEFSQY